MQKKVVFLGMGGTIAGTATQAEDNVGYTAAQRGVADLLGAVPGLARILGDCLPESEQVCQIDSKDLVAGDWQRLHARAAFQLARPEVAGVVVTHGTDTLEETAFFLSRTLPTELLASKPLVLTCAMRPATAQAPDGPANMADAVAVVMSGAARGVLVACAGKLHAGERVQKVFPYRVDAFDSGESGPLGLVEEGRLRLLGAWPQPGADLHPRLQERLQAGLPWPRVEILLSHADAGAGLVRALLADARAPSPLRGIVVAGTGNGTIHRAMEAALRDAVAQGVRVVRVSRCAYGQVVVGAGPQDAMAALGLSAVKARIALMLDLLCEAPGP